MSELSAATPGNYSALYEYIGALSREDRMTPAVEASAEKAVAVRTNHEKVFYLAGPLTGMSEETKLRYNHVSGLIATFVRPGARMFGYAPHLHGTDPVKHPDVTPAEVRDIDYMYAVKVPDYHINFLHPLAHGNAIEEGWAEEAGIPALYVVPRGLKLSRLVLGMRNIVETVRYDNFQEEGLAGIQTFLNEVERGVQSDSV